MHTSTPIYDRLVDDGMWPDGLDRHATESEFKRAYASERPRWASLMDRLKASGD